MSIIRWRLVSGSALRQLVASFSFVIFSACVQTSLVNLTLLLPPNDPVREQIDSVAIYINPNQNSSPQLSTHIKNGYVAIPNFKLHNEKSLEIVVKGTANSSSIPIAVGHAHIDINTRSTQSYAVTVYFGPNDHFASHPHPSLIHRRRFGVVTLKDHKIWIIGGEGLADLSGKFLSKTEIYDPATLTFSAGPDLSEGRADPMVGVIQDPTSQHEIIVVAGGENGDSFSATAQAIDPSTLRTGPAFFMSQGARARSGVLPLGDNRIALVGGQSNDVTTAHTIEVISVDANLSLSFASTFNPGQSLFLSQARIAPGVFPLADGSALIAGGVDTPDISQLAKDQSLLTTVNNFNVIRNAPASFAISKDTLFVAGGGDRSIESWAYQSHQLPTIFAELPETRINTASITLVDGSLLITGGDIIDDVAAQTQASNNYLFSLNAPTLQRNFVAARSGHQLVLTSTSTVLAIGGSDQDPSVEILAVDQ